MLSVEEKVIEQVGEIATKPLKNFVENKNIRKNILANYEAKKEIEIIEQIMSSDSITLEHKAILVPYIRGGMKKFYNQLKILDIALDDLETKNSQVTTIDKDWINDFWEKAKNISDKENQITWGKVLSFNFANGDCTKTLLNALYLLDQKKMNNFDKIRRISFQHATDIYRIYSCIYFIEDSEFYNKYGLYGFCIEELMRLGLVEYNWNNEFSLPTNRIILKYGEQKIEINSNTKMKYGNVRYTSDGALLFRALSPIYDIKCLEYCIEKWRSRGAIVYRE